MLASAWKVCLLFVRTICLQAVVFPAILPFIRPDRFGSKLTGPAWKHMGQSIGTPQYHRDRQWVAKVRWWAERGQTSMQLFFQHNRFPSSYEAC